MAKRSIDVKPKDERPYHVQILEQVLLDMAKKGELRLK